MSSTGGELPQQIIVADILPRLPAKSLCRFKSVSKPWRALISDPHFLKTHLSLHTTTTPDTLILVSPSGSLFSLHFHKSLTAIATKIDIPLPEQPIEQVDVLASNPLSKSKFIFPSFEGPEHPSEWVDVLGSCNGLLLLSDKSTSKFILNPSTRLYKQVPGLSYLADNFHANCSVMYGLGYDPSMDDYKVVRICHYWENFWDDDGLEVYATDFEVYGLKSSSWKKVKNYPYDSCCFRYSKLVCVHGSIHWITNYDLGSNVIAAYDLADENFRDVPPPISLDNIKMGHYDLTVIGGCLCMFPCQNSKEISVWVMKKYGVVESWTEIKIIRPNNVASIVPLCMLRDGDVLLKMDGCELVSYNPEEGSGREMVVHGYSGSIGACATYVDSLVSPNCNNGVARQDGAFRQRSDMDLSSISMAMEGTYEAGSTSSSNIIEASSSVTDPFSPFNGLDCFIGMDDPKEQTYEEEDLEDV